MSLAVVEYDARGAFTDLEDDWQRLYAGMPSRASTQSVEAQRAYYDLFLADPDKFRCLCITDGEAVRAIVPLEARDDRYLGVPVPVWAIPLHPHQPLADVVCADPEVLAVLAPLVASHLRRHPRGRPLVVLGPLPDGSPLWSGLSHLGASEWCTNTPIASHVFDCSGSFEALEARLSKSFRAKQRKARNKLAALEDVRIVHAREEPELAAECETFLRVEASGWKGAEGTRTAVVFCGRQPDLYRRLARTFGPGDGCEINSLYAEGRCIATQYCMRTGDQYAVLKSGYDESYARVSPGQLLRADTLRRCCEDPTVARCSLVSDYSWQDVWRPDTVVMRQAHIAIGRYTGRALIASLRFRFGAGRSAARWARAKASAAAATARRVKAARRPPQ